MCACVCGCGPTSLTLLVPGSASPTHLPAISSSLFPVCSPASHSLISHSLYMSVLFFCFWSVCHVFLILPVSASKPFIPIKYLLICINSASVLSAFGSYPAFWSELQHWVGGSIRATLFVSHLQSQGCVWAPDFFFFSTHTQNGKLADREEIFFEFDRKCIGLES